MKTEYLKTLQSSITPGEWMRDDVWMLIKSDNIEICAIHSGVNHPTRQNRHVATQNAFAIALVPELIAEAIKLRDALQEISQWSEGDDSNLNSLPELFAIARAALENT